MAKQKWLIGYWLIRKPKQWDLALAQAEFAHNNVVHQTTGKASLAIVYTKALRQALDRIKLLGGHGASVAMKNMEK